MSSAYLGAFAAIALIAVTGVDYVNQSRKAADTSEGFGFSDYVSTITGRFVDQQAVLAAEKERNRLLSMAPRDHLPPAPEGWNRTGWDAGAEALFGGQYDLQKDDFVPEEIKNDPTLKTLAGMSKAIADSRDAEEIYVYAKPGAVIALRLSVLSGEPSGISGMATKMVANNIEAMSGKTGFAVVKGVTFREELGLFGAGAQEREHKVVTGQIGKRLRLSVRALADDADVLTLLNMVDYDTLNAMLDKPLPDIGSNAPAIAVEDQQAEAERRVAEAARKQRIKAGAANLDLQMAALEINHRHGRLDDAEYARVKAELEAASSALLDEAVTGTGTPSAAETKTGAGEPPAADIQTAAAEAPQEAKGGFFGMLSGFFGGGAAAEEETPDKAGKVRVNRGGGGNCSKSGVAKRCKIGD